MSDISIHILGCGSARPTRQHLPSAQLLSAGGHHYLIDAGEGVQHTLLTSGHKFSQIDAIFITHHHGDHIFGLPGLLTSMAHLERTKPLSIVTTSATADFVRYIVSHFIESISFDLNLTEVDAYRVTHKAYSDLAISVDTLPLQHRIDAVGFLITEQVAPRRINPTATHFYKIPFDWMHRLQLGLDYVPPHGGAIIPNRVLTTAGRPARRYAYLSDTAPAMHLIKEIRGIDLLYHEATYDSSYADRAAQYGHSTALQAAEVARTAEVKRLLIGHYSGRYDTTDLLLEEARATFPHTSAAQEGDLYHL